MNNLCDIRRELYFDSPASTIHFLDFYWSFGVFTYAEASTVAEQCGDGFQAVSFDHTGFEW
jgi:hypothetical protein